MNADPVLAGRTALLLRDPARAASTVAALAGRGARAMVCRLLDFELPAHADALDAGLARLLAGGFDWLVLTSANTVRAMSLRAAALDLELDIPARTRIAVVGEATARAARALGARVDFMPAHDHSARGMLAEWQALSAGPPATVFMPQADIASSTLRDGFAAAGWEAHIAVAYRTVSAPADPARALWTPSKDPGLPGNGLPGNGLPGNGQSGAAEMLAPAGIPGALASIDAVFFTSPSTVEAFLALVPEPEPRIALVAIGDSTAARLRTAGLRPAGIAAFPTPDGLVAAWEQSLHGATPDRAPSTNHR